MESDDDLDCPKCGRDLYRTDGMRFDRSHQTPVGGTPSVDYEVVPLTYDNDNGQELDR